MKGKPLTIVLILVVGIVWYQVFIRVRSNFVTNEQSTVAPVVASKSIRSLERLSFKLNANYRDPFMGTVRATKDTTRKTTSSAPPKPKPQPVEVSWPKITYYGFVRNVSASNPRALVGIDGELFKLKAGEEALDNLKVIHVWRDSIRFRYRNTSRSFRKR